MRGTAAKEARRKSALVRLELHLKNHKENHKDDFTNGRFDEEKKWLAHDKAQRKECDSIVLK